MINIFGEQVPQRWFTSKELMEMLNINSGSLSNIKKLFQLDVKVEKTDDGRKSFWSYTDYLIIKEYWEKKAKVRDAKKIDREKIKMAYLSASIEQLQKEHPLVKDNRFFTLTYFPDVVPNIYKDKEYEEC